MDFTAGLWNTSKIQCLWMQFAVAFKKKLKLYNAMKKSYLNMIQKKWRYEPDDLLEREELF